MAREIKVDAALEEFKSLRRRYQATKSDRSCIEGQWDEIEHFTGPLDDGSSSSQGSTAGAPVSRKDVWDLTAIEGRERLTSRMHGSMIPSTVRWFQGAYRKATLNKDPEATKFRDLLVEEVWNMMASSDFYTEMASLLHDTTGPGISYISFEPVVGEINPKTMQEDLQGFDFRAISFRDGYFEPDRKGDIRVFWERFMWTPSEIYDFHLKKQAEATTDEERVAWACPEDIINALNAGQKEVEEIVFCVFPRDKISKRKKTVYPAAPKNRPWGCMWWREKNGQRLGYEGGYYERPIYMARWSKTPGSRWAHGPGNVALPTVKYVNGWREQYRVAGEKALDPSFLTNERNVLTDVDQRPGRGTVVRDVNAIREFESKSNFVVADKIIQDDIQQIRAIFHMDDLQLKESPAMTATEVQVRYEIMSQILGKVLTFFQTFVLGPIIEAAISMLTRFGRIPEMPDIVKKNGGTVSIEYQGPLARSQRMDEVAAVERWITMVYGMAQFDPRMRATIDPKKIGRYVRERLGVPADLEPTEAEMNQRMKEIDDMQVKMAQSQVNANEAKASKDRASAGAAGPAGPVPNAKYPELPPNPRLAPSGMVA
jgi:hypothetical protein